jgi:hypothetical protein
VAAALHQGILATVVHYIDQFFLDVIAVSLGNLGATWEQCAHHEVNHFHIEHLALLYELMEKLFILHRL